MSSQYENGSSRRLTMDELTRMNAPIPRVASQDEVLRRLESMHTELTDTLREQSKEIAEREAKNIGAAMGIPLAVVLLLIQKAMANELDDAREVFTHARLAVAPAPAESVVYGYDDEEADDLDGDDDDYEIDNGEEDEYDSDNAVSDDDGEADDLDEDDKSDYGYDDDGKEVYDEEDDYGPDDDQNDDQDEDDSHDFQMKLW